MLGKIIFLCIVVGGLSINVLNRGVFSAVGEQPETAPLPRSLQPKPKPEIKNTGHYGGVVTGLGVDWVEIGPDWTGVTFNGKRLWDEKESKKPKRISAAGTFIGGDPDGLCRWDTYRLIDLRVGDKITIETAITRDGEELCLEILLLRRPGGKIPRLPRLPGRFEFSEDTHHLRHQAEQDWEEKRIPIPEKYLDHYGQAPWTDPPYLPPMRAPMPREVKPTIPPAKP